MSGNTVAFVIIFVVAILAFLWSCWRRFGLLRIGKPDVRWNQVGTRIVNMISYALFQKRVIGRPFGFNHFFLFWGFLVLLIANAEFLLGGLFPSVISFHHLKDSLPGLYVALAWIFDIVSLVVLVAVVIAVIRRLFFPPKYIDALSSDAFIILGMVALLMIAYFGLHATEAVLLPMAGFYQPPYPIARLIGDTMMANTDIGRLIFLQKFYWWEHAVVLLAFLNYLPYSKHMHVLAAVPNCFFRSLEKVNTQSREEFVAGNTYGAGDVTGFPWKGLFDSYACTECGRCTDVCPAASTDKPLNPRLIMHDIKDNLLANGGRLSEGLPAEQPLIGEGESGTISPDAIWSCTTCGACMEVCPVFNEHVPRIVEMRRHLVEMKADFPEELLLLFENMEQRSNPWGIAPPDRTKWTTGLDIKPFVEGETEYLFYVGCAGAFDSRARQVTLAMAKILDAAGISWGILGKDELCCGDSLRRLGNEYVYDQMVRQNIDLFEEKGVKKMITQCPHCFSTFKNDYRQYGVALQVYHHTELIDELLSEGRLKLDGVDAGRLVFHDSCYLGRYNEIYDEPRAALAAATGQAPLELSRSIANSFCCGAGGGRMWMEETLGTRIDKTRVQEALGQSPDAICVACPYCMTMFEDGLKDLNADENIRVLDVAEIVAKSLKK